jgi:hypothetical protein
MSAEDYRRGRTGDAGVMRGNRPDPAQFIPIFKEKSRLIFLPNYGCLESLSGQSSMPTGL